MCGRYQFSIQGNRTFAQIVRSAQRHTREPVDVRVAGDICPAQVAPVLVARGGKVVAEFQQWGLPAPHGGLIINARAETAAEKPMFRRSMADRRCVIPASAYYEWDAGRHKYRFERPGQALYLAGVYAEVDGCPRYVILTTAPNASVQDIHDRMPLILTHEQVRPWLTDTPAALALLRSEPPRLQRRCEDGQLSFQDLNGGSLPPAQQI